MAKWLIIVVILAVLLTEFAASQQLQEPSAIKKPTAFNLDRGFGPLATATPSETSSRSDMEIKLSLGVLAFGLILVIFTGIVAYKKNSGWDQEATRIFAVSVIVTAGLFLITAGYSDQQIAPMFGLLGTIVGYLLGKTSPGEQGPKTGV